MRKGGEDGFALGLHEPAFFLSSNLHFVWLWMFHFAGILASPRGTSQKVTLLFCDGLLGWKFVLVQHWKKPKALEGLGLSWNIHFQRGKQKPFLGSPPVMRRFTRFNGGMSQPAWPHVQGVLAVPGQSPASPAGTTPPHFKNVNSWEDDFFPFSHHFIMMAKKREKNKLLWKQHCFQWRWATSYAGDAIGAMLVRGAVGGSIGQPGGPWEKRGGWFPK